jgi:hypothetical protein
VIRLGQSTRKNERMRRLKLQMQVSADGMVLREHKRMVDISTVIRR